MWVTCGHSHKLQLHMLLTVLQLLLLNYIEFTVYYRSVLVRERKFVAGQYWLS